MKTKELVILKSIAIVEDKIKQIKFLLDAKPLSEICKIRQEAQKLLEENKTIEERTSPNFVRRIADLSKREREQFAIAEKAKDSYKLIWKKVNLEFELKELNNELFYLKKP